MGELPSTKAVAGVINGLPGRNVLVILQREDDLSLKSVRNLRDVHVLTYDQLNAYDVLVSDDLVFTEGAFNAFVAFNTKSASTGSATEKEEVSA